MRFQTRRVTGCSPPLCRALWQHPERSDPQSSVPGGPRAVGEDEYCRWRLGCRSGEPAREIRAWKYLALLCPPPAGALPASPKQRQRAHRPWRRAALDRTPAARPRARLRDRRDCGSPRPKCRAKPRWSRHPTIPRATPGRGRRRAGASGRPAPAPARFRATGADCLRLRARRRSQAR